LKHFIDDGAGWISFGSGDIPGSNGFSVTLLYDDPANVVGLVSPASKWNYKVRLIAIYRFAGGFRTLHALGELDQIAARETTNPNSGAKLIVRMLGWDAANVYYRTGDGTTGGVLSGGSLSPEERRELYEKAQVVYPAYALETGKLTFLDGWLAPELTGETMSKKTMHPKLEGRVFAGLGTAADTYHFSSVRNLYGAAPEYFTESSTLGNADGIWWSIGDTVYTEDTATGAISVLGDVTTATAGGGERVRISTETQTFSEVYPGGGGFENRIWILPKNGGPSDYISFDNNRIKTSANLAAASVTPAHLSSNGGYWFGADGLDLIYVQQDITTNLNSIVLFDNGTNVTYDDTDNTFSVNGVTSVLEEIKAVPDLGTWNTLKGIWAVRKTTDAAGYFYFDSQDDPRRADTSKGNFTVYARVKTNTAADETGDIFEVSQNAGAPPTSLYRGSYIYRKAPNDDLQFRDDYTSTEDDLGDITGASLYLKKLSPGTDTGLWVKADTANVEYLVFSTGGLLAYGIGGAGSWTSPIERGVPWYVNGDDLFVLKEDGSIASLGVLTNPDTIASANYDVFGGAAVNLNRVAAADNTEFKGGLWARGTDPLSWGAIYEDPLNPGRYGYSVMGYAGFKGGLYRGSANPSALYLYDTNALGSVKVVYIGTYSKSGYMDADYNIDINGGISNLTGLSLYKKGSASLVSGEGAFLARPVGDSRFMILKPNGDVTVDTDAAAGGVVKGIFYTSGSELVLNNEFFILDNDGMFKQLGKISALNNGKIAALAATNGSVPGAVTLNALTTGSFNTRLGSDKWADASASLRWIYAGEDKTLRYSSSGSVGYNSFYEEDSAAAVKNFYSLDPETGDAVYFGAYNGSVQDTISFSGTGGVLSSLGTVRKLEGGAAGIKGIWASSKNTQESTFLEIADDTITVEKGSYTNSFAVPVPGSRIADKTTLLSYHSAGGTYALYGLRENGDMVYYGTSGLLTPRNGADALTPGSASAKLSAFSGPGSPLNGLAFEGINDFDLPQDLVGSWIKDGGSAGRDDILISDTGVTVGGNDLSPNGTFVYGAKNLGGTLYATLVSATAAPNYQWKFYVYNERNGLVYLGQGAFTRTSATAGPVNTLTFGTQTTVVKGGSVFKK
jgi:hypothetical protein